MLNQQKLIGYHAGTTFLHRLSGASKLLFFILVSTAAMISYDTRLLLVIAVGSLFLFKVSHIHFKDVSFILIFAGLFATLNLIMVYLFAPQYGVEIYGEQTVWLSGLGSYTVTAQEIFYLFNLK